jgi:hypothetical protein
MVKRYLAVIFALLVVLGGLIGAFFYKRMKVNSKERPSLILLIPPASHRAIENNLPGPPPMLNPPLPAPQGEKTPNGGSPAHQHVKEPTEKAEVSPHRISLDKPSARGAKISSRKRKGNVAIKEPLVSTPPLDAFVQIKENALNPPTLSLPISPLPRASTSSPDETKAADSGGMGEKELSPSPSKQQSFKRPKGWIKKPNFDQE